MGSVSSASAATCAEPGALAGFLDATVQAVAAGLTVSTLRWLFLDTLHHRTGISPPAWDFSSLRENVRAFEFLVQIHYWYYKFYGNMALALLCDLVRRQAPGR